MTKLGLAPGVSLPTSQRRLAPGYMQPTIVGDGTSAASSARTVVSPTASATPHTKGSWVQAIAATTSDITYVMLSLTGATNQSAADSSTLLDIGIGAAASEVVIVPNLAIGYQSSVNTNLYEIPVYIPVGSRVAVRCQSVTASLNLNLALVYAQLPHGRRSPTSIVDMGTSLASSHGVGLSVPGGTNTKGAWTQITAATAEPYEALMIGVQGNADATLAAGGVLLDIGYGASGSEVVLGPDLPLTASSVEALTWGLTPLIPCRLPAGTRLAARYQSTSVGNSMDVILYGVRP